MNQIVIQKGIFASIKEHNFVLKKGTWTIQKNMWQLNPLKSFNYNKEKYFFQKGQ